MPKTLKLPYANREYDAILAEIRNRLATELPESNDWLESNVGRWIIETFAAIADMTSFTIDRQAAECYLDTVETRENLVAILKLLGFQPFNPVPEETDVVFTLNKTAASDVQIPKNTRLFSSVTSLPWLTMTATAVRAGSQTATTQARQGEYRSIDFVSSGNPFQQFVINSTKVAQAEVQVTVDGNAWQPAGDGEPNHPPSMVGLGGDAEYFLVIHTQDMKTMIQFGDGIDGLIPPKGAQIVVQVLLTEHVNGHANAHQIDQVVDIIAPSGNGITVDNPTASGGGLDHESIASARLRWPGVFASQNRAVTLADYEAQARLVPGVLQARAVDHSMDDSVMFFEVNLYIVGGNGLPSDSLNQQVAPIMDQVKMNPVTVNVISPSPVNVDILITQLFVNRQFVKENVAALVLTTISDFFTMTSDGSGPVNLGTNIVVSQLAAAIQNVEGVSSFTWMVRELSSEDAAANVAAAPTLIVSNTLPIGAGGVPIVLPDDWEFPLDANGHPTTLDAPYIVVGPHEYAFLNSALFVQVPDPQNPSNTIPNIVTV